MFPSLVDGVDNQTRFGSKSVIDKNPQQALLALFDKCMSTPA
jgi:hypothetical protein